MPTTSPRRAVLTALGAVLVVALPGSQVTAAATGDEATSTVIGTTARPTGPCAGDYALLQVGDPSSTFRVPHHGVVTSWTYTAADHPATSVALRIGRRSEANSGWSFVGGSTDLAGAANSTVAGAARLPVLAGDVLGMRVSGGHDCVTATHTVGDEVLVSLATAARGPVVEEFRQGLARLPVSAVVESDHDRDGYGDVTQDACPTQSTTQRACATAFTARVKPKLVGRAKVGNTLRLANVSASNFTPAPGSVRFQWYRGATRIVGATLRTYRVKRVDAGRRLEVVVKVAGSVPTRTYQRRTTKVVR